MERINLVVNKEQLQLGFQITNVYMFYPALTKAHGYYILVYSGQSNTPSHRNKMTEWFEIKQYASPGLVYSQLFYEGLLISWFITDHSYVIICI